MAASSAVFAYTLVAEKGSGTRVSVVSVCHLFALVFAISVFRSCRGVVEWLIDWLSHINRSVRNPAVVSRKVDAPKANRKYAR